MGLTRRSPAWVKDVSGRIARFRTPVTRNCGCGVSMKRWPAFWIAPPCCRISNPNPEYPPQLKTVRFFSGRLGRCTRTLFYGGVFSEIYLDLQKVGPDGCCRIFRPLFRGASSDG